MGQGLSCGERHENGLFRAVQNGDLELVQAMVEADPTVLEQTTPRTKMSALHIAAAYGQIEVGLDSHQFLMIIWTFVSDGVFFSLLVENFAV